MTTVPAWDRSKLKKPTRVKQNEAGDLEKGETGALPDFVLLEVLCVVARDKFLGPRSLGHCARVCRRWRRLVTAGQAVPWREVPRILLNAKALRALSRPGERGSPPPSVVSALTAVQLALGPGARDRALDDAIVSLVVAFLSVSRSSIRTLDLSGLPAGTSHSVKLCEVVSSMTNLMEISAPWGMNDACAAVIANCRTIRTVRHVNLTDVVCSALEARPADWPAPFLERVPLSRWPPTSGTTAALSRSLRGIMLSGGTTGGALSACLSACPNICELSMSHYFSYDDPASTARSTDVPLIARAPIRQLAVLDLDGSNETLNGLVTPLASTLTSLNIRCPGHGITSAGLADILRRLPNLRKFKMSDVPYVTYGPEFLGALGALPSLEKLRLKDVTERHQTELAGMLLSARNLRHIEFLDWGRGFKYEQAVFMAMAKMQSLQRLKVNVRGCDAIGEIIANVPGAFPALRELTIKDVGKLKKFTSKARPGLVCFDYQR